MKNHTASCVAQLVSLAGLLLALALPAAAAPLAVPGAPGIHLLTSDEILSARTERTSTGDLLFQDANGARIRFITSPSDPQIQNPGNGAFHPVDPSAVMDALAEIPQEFLAGLQVDIFLLPYPRSGMLSSSADSRAIYLTPGVLPYEPYQIHFLLAHEMGHCVHRALLPDGNETGWAEWAALRGVTDPAIYNAQSAHADRPHEIFAEDFRVLFGGALARQDGSIENRHLASPQSIPALAGFYRGLAGALPADLASGWSVYPNPARLGRQLTLRAPSGRSDIDGDLQAELFDASGRSAGRVSLTRISTTEWSIPAALDASLASGVYWLRMAAPGSNAVALALRLSR